MAAATTTMSHFLCAAKDAFAERFEDTSALLPDGEKCVPPAGYACVLLPDGYALKVKDGYEGAMIVLALEYAARDPEQEQGGFDPPALATLRVRVYTAVGFTEYDGKPDAYLSGLALVSDIIGWCDCRRFVPGQYGLQFVSMDTADYDVTETFQVQWVIDFTAPLRFDHDRTPTAPADDFVSFGDYEGKWPVRRVRAKIGDPDEISRLNPDLVYPMTIVGVLSAEMPASSTTLTLAADATRNVSEGDYLQVQLECVLVTAVASQSSFTVDRAQLDSDRTAHAVGQEVALLPRPS